MLTRLKFEIICLQFQCAPALPFASPDKLVGLLKMGDPHMGSIPQVYDIPARKDKGFRFSIHLITATEAENKTIAGMRFLKPGSLFVLLIFMTYINKT
jgi:hypothetical protein